MWITEITLRQSARRLSFDSGLTHRWLTLAADGPDFLWVSPRPGLIIATSPRPLNSDAMRDSAEHVFSAERDTHFAMGQRLEIAGIVAPTKCETRPGQRGKIRTLAPTEVPDWIERKFYPALTIKTLDLQHLPNSRGVKRDGTRVMHPRVSVHTTGFVTNPNALTNLLENGVGRGKRFGAGMVLAKELA